MSAWMGALRVTRNSQQSGVNEVREQVQVQGLLRVELELLLPQVCWLVVDFENDLLVALELVQLHESPSPGGYLLLLRLVVLEFEEESSVLPHHVLKRHVQVDRVIEDHV